MGVDVAPSGRDGSVSRMVSPPAVNLLCRLAIAGIVLYVILDVVAQLLPPHYSPIRQAESDLAVGPYGWIMTVNFVVRGLFSAAILIVLRRCLQVRHASLGLALLGVWMIAAFVLALFPTDLVGEHSVHGIIHLVVALLAFVSVTVAVELLSRSLADSPLWHTVGTRAAWIAHLVVAAFVVEILTSKIHRISGLTERLFLASVLLWLAVVAVNVVVAGRRVQAPVPD
ncbi:MAG: DUF998 domain-containing protein [Chloroflexota bacterium]